MQSVDVGIRDDLPELGLIHSEQLQKQVIAAWEMALKAGGWMSMGEAPILSRDIQTPGSGVEHLRGTARIAYEMARCMQDLHHIEVATDHIVAGALLHDLGKVVEFGNNQYSGVGVRHPFFGAHIAMSADLPPEVVEIIASHSVEGQFVSKSLATVIVKYADFVDADGLFRRELGRSAYEYRPYVYLPPQR